MMRLTAAVVSLIVVLLVISALPALKVEAKQWTVYERQVELRKRVEKGYKANELTEKEAKKLNDRLDDIVRDADKMKSKNGDKLSYKDQGKLEKRLNAISLVIQKYELKKRVEAR